MADEPIWLAKARTYVGLAEIPGKQHSPTILRWWKALKTTIRDDETAWCGAFIGGVLAECAIKTGKGGPAARSWLDMGTVLEKPALGCVVVFWRGSKAGWSGHVGFVAGKDHNGNLMVLGGNQGDRVSIKPFSLSRVLGYRWPTGFQPMPSRYSLPAIDSSGQSLSTNEA